MIPAPAGDRALADPMVPEPFRVDAIRRETRDTWTLEITPADGRDDTSFAPGQFNMLFAPGVGEMAISVSGDPRARGRFVHTVRTVGMGTGRLCSLVKGDRLGVRGPFGTAWPTRDNDGRDVVIVAGGIGLAPLRPALLDLMHHRDRAGRIALLYGARTPEDLLYKRELQSWRKRFDLQVEITVDRAASDWRGDVGVVPQLLRRAAFDPARVRVLVCGPEIMMHFTVLELGKLHVPDESIFVSIERNMKCGLGFCGHCQLGPFFACKDGPVIRWDRVKPWLTLREV